MKPNTRYIFLFPKNASWVLLTLFFVFDSTVSYWGVKYMHGREADLLIAPLVEKYPLLYFLIIPVLLLTMFIVIKLIKKIAIVIFKKWGIASENIIERIILSAIVLYWAVGNSSDNLIFLLGYRVSNVWVKTTIFAIPITLIYVLYIIFQVFEFKKIN